MRPRIPAYGTSVIDQNRGSTFNHNFVIEQARGELFKWVSDDDLYAPELLQRCIEALDSRPEMVLAHAWTAFIDDDGQDHRRDRLSADDRCPRSRRSASGACSTPHGGDDIYGVIRMSVLRQISALRQLPLGRPHLRRRAGAARSVP